MWLGFDCWIGWSFTFQLIDDLTLPTAGFTFWIEYNGWIRQFFSFRFWRNATVHISARLPTDLCGFTRSRECQFNNSNRRQQWIISSCLYSVSIPGNSYCLGVDFCRMLQLISQCCDKTVGRKNFCLERTDEVGLFLRFELQTRTLPRSSKGISLIFTRYSIDSWVKSIWIEQFIQLFFLVFQLSLRFRTISTECVAFFTEPNRSPSCWNICKHPDFVLEWQRE